MKKALRWIDLNLEPLVQTVLFFVMLAIIVVQVILRFFFETGFAWGEEIARTLYVWLCFFSLSYATKTNRHIGMTFIRNSMPPTIQKIILILTDILFMVFLVFMAKASFDTLATTAMFGDKLQSIEVTKNIVFAAASVGYLLAMVRLLQSFIWKIKRFNCSLTLFINERGYYNGANDVFLVPKSFKKELAELIDPDILKEEQAIQNKGGKS